MASPPPSATSAAPSGSSRLSWPAVLRLATGSATPTWPVREAIWRAVDHWPTPGQLQVHQGQNHLGQPCRRKLIKGGIQSGKSKLVAAEILSLLPWIEDEIWLCGPDFRQSRKECEYLIEWTKDIGLFDPHNASLPQSDAPWTFTLKTGHVIKTFSGVNARKMAGSKPGLVALVEAGQCSQDVYQTARARVGLTDCPFLVSGTIEESEGWYISLAEAWAFGRTPDAIAYSLPTWSNTALFPGGRLDPKIVAYEHDPTVSSDVFLMRYAGETVAPPGLVFGPTAYHPGFSPLTHVAPIALTDAPLGAAWGYHFPADTPVWLAIDPGWEHAYAVLACVVDKETNSVFVLDELYEKGIDAPGMIAIARSRPWWGNVRHAVMDIGGKQHHGAPLTNLDYWRGAPPVGAGLPVWAEERVPIDEGTNKIRALLQTVPDLQRPRLLIDPRCKNLQWEMRQGYRNLVDHQGRPVGKPIDRNNDAVKALHYLVHVVFPGLTEKTARASRKVRKTQSMPWLERTA